MKANESKQLTKETTELKCIVDDHVRFHTELCPPACVNAFQLTLTEGACSSRGHEKNSCMMHGYILSLLQSFKILTL